MGRPSALSTAFLPTLLPSRVVAVLPVNPKVTLDDHSVREASPIGCRPFPSRVVLYDESPSGRGEGLA
jgi:hypothetical protein